MTPEKGPEKLAQIVSLSTMNLLERKISRQVKISKIAVHNAIKKFQNERTLKDSERSGRPRISSRRDERVIRKVLSQSPFSSAKKVQARMAERDIKISEKTIRRRLSMESYSAAQPLQKNLDTLGRTAFFCPGKIHVYPGKM